MRKCFRRGVAIVLSAAIAISGIAVTKKQTGEVKAAATYELVWSDEFEGDSLNRDNWNVEVNGYGGWNNELQYYCDSPENIEVSNGTLKITALKKNYMDKEYTSARLNSEGKAEFRFGKVEAKIKLPSFKGAWPAFWMLGANGEMWPKCGEIDILETINDESIVYGTAHWANGDSYESNGSSTLPTGAKIDITQWHTYGIEWDENKIVWYVDDIKYHTLDISTDPNRASLALDQYLILNLAIGGDWPGFEIDDSAIPATMEVDYVRVYEKNNDVPTITVKDDSVEKYQGSWSSTIGSWAGAVGTVTTKQEPKDGFEVNLTSVGNDMWGAQTSLSDISYIAGNNYTFRCTLTSDIDKNVFVKVEGDNNTELAADNITLKANQPYNYERTLFIPNTYTGKVSLFFAYGGGVNEENIDSASAMHLKVENVEFYTEAEVEDTTEQEKTTEKATTQEPTTEKETTQEPTTEKATTQEPTTEKATTQEPTTEKATTQEPTTEKATTQEPTTEKATTQEPTTEKITTQNAITNIKPVNEQNITKPGKVKINKINRTSKNKKAKVFLKGIKDVTGYQVKYSVSEKFAKKKTEIVYTKKPSIVLKGLKEDKTYYVKARAYVTINGKNYFGNWSSKKIVKVKK